MWWLYCQGTREDLWNSVPPSMAQRVFAGMLNETLTILTVRYTQTVPSKARSQLLLVDVTNILLCVAELLPSICDFGEAYIGLNIKNQTKIVRDIHAKCHELFCCLLLRGAPLGILYKLLKKGTESVGMFQQRKGYPSPWMIFSWPKMFNMNGHLATKVSEFGTFAALTIELKVLLASPQANWPLLIKVLLMRDAHLSQIIFHHLMKFLPACDEFVDSHMQPCMNIEGLKTKCDGFLCGKECKDIAEWAAVQHDPVKQTNYQALLALSYIIIMVGKKSDINRTLISALDKTQIKNWAHCLDRRQVWNQKRPPWLEAIIHLVYPILDPIALMLINAMQTGASNYQSMALAITCISDIIDAIPDCLYTVISCLTEILPADIKPLYDSVLIQILFCALYTKLLECAAGEEEENEIPIIVNGENVFVRNVIKSQMFNLCFLSSLISMKNLFQKAILQLLYVQRRTFVKF
jgi:protein KIAA0825